MKKLLLPILFFISTGIINSQTFTNSTGGAITDNNTYVYYPIVVSGLPSNLNTTSFGIENVSINLTHTNDADLRIKLQNPQGTIYVLTSYYGGTGDNYTNTFFADSSSRAVSTGTAPFLGFYKSVDPIANFNSGITGNGTWQLMIKDQTTTNTGTLLSWSITFGINPAGLVSFHDSNLPIVVINTAGSAAILDEPKVRARMGIIYNGPGVRNYMTDPFNNYSDSIGIEQRGSSSGGFPQKQYGFETRNNMGQRLDTTLLGMPAEHDWVLYAPYNDKTCMRNVLAYDIANRTGHYASRTKYCELILNGNYQGIYTLMEKIKRDSNRVSVARLDANDLAGDSLTGGYIIKIDKLTGSASTSGWTSNVLSSSGAQMFIQYHYPSGDSILPAQASYIHSYVDSFETALNGVNFANPVTGYRAYIGVSSFMDYFILNEISNNVDGYRLSTYLHKDKWSNGGKLKAGPAWDYNLAFWNANYCSGNSYSVWCYLFNNVCGGDSFQVPFWWAKLLQDPAYANELKCRWLELRQSTLSLTRLNNYIDSTASYLNEAQARHFVRWPILGVYTWPNPTPLATTYAGEVTAMKTWISNRMTWLDANMPGTCAAATASFATFTSPVICTGNTVAFNDESTFYPTSWSWSFPGGTPSTSTLQNPVVTYNTAGNYNVTLTATNGGGTGTPVTVSNYITVNPGPTVTVNSTSVCSGASATLTAGGATTYLWSAGATSTGVTTASVSPTTTTTYTVTGSSLGCSSTATSTVTVNPSPTVTVNSVSVCSGTTVTLTANGATSYTWSAGATSTGVATATASPTTSTSYTVTGTALGCSSTAVSNITVTPTPVVVVNSPSICTGSTAALTASGATSYVWSAGATTTGVSTADASPTSTTTYTVTGSNLGCVGTATSTVTVNSLPIVNVNSSTICSGASATLTATGATTYSWSTGATATGVNTATASPTTTTTYTVTGTGLFCSGTATASITVNPTPVVTVNSVGICSGDTAILTAAGASSYTWSAGATSTGVSTASASPTSTTSYTVTGTDLGCSGTATATVLVSTTPPTPTISAVGNVLTSSAVSGNQWYLNGVLIAGATSQNYTMFVDGTYTVIASNGGCASIVSLPFVYTTVGFISMESNSEIMISPNPANGIFQVYSLNLQIEKIQIYNIIGKILFESAPMNQRMDINLSNVASGIYFVEVTTSNKTERKKLMLH